MENFSERVVFLIVFFPLFLIAISFHEAAHAFAAYRSGDPTAKLLGRLSLNPMVHIDPIGLLFFVVSSVMGIGFGWAKPVPVNPLMFRKMRRDDIIVSLAGVGANLALMIVTAVLIKILIYAGIFVFTPGGPAGPTYGVDYVRRILMHFMLLNGVLVVFNLLPIPPLDGSHVVINLFSKDPAMVEAKVARFGFLFLFIILFTGALDFVLHGAVIAMLNAAQQFFSL